MDATTIEALARFLAKRDRTIRDRYRRFPDQDDIETAMGWIAYVDDAAVLYRSGARLVKDQIVISMDKPGPGRVKAGPSHRNSSSSH